MTTKYIIITDKGKIYGPYEQQGSIQELWDKKFLKVGKVLPIDNEPTYDKATQKLEITRTDVSASYKVVDLPLTEQQAIRDKEFSQKVEQLWTAATRYETEYISGSAVGILTALVLSNNTKALAVQEWILSIWNEYYVRKAALQNDPFMEIDLDFSYIGPIPHTVPELIAERFPNV